MKHSVREVQLSNGLKGLVVNVPDADVVHMQISFRAGEFLLERNKWETAHLLEHLMLGANDTYKTARKFQEELEKNGAYSNATTSPYDITYEVETASFDAARVLTLVCNALVSPQFLESEFRSESSNVAEELILRSNNHFRSLNIALREQEGYCAVPDAERATLLKNVTIEDIKNHYATTHSIKNARFIISGNITNDLLDILSTLSFDCDIDRIGLPEEPIRKLSSAVVLQRKEVSNIYFYVDMHAKQLLNTRQKDSLTILTTLLTETLHSLLLGTARERGLVYAMGSGQQQSKNIGSFWLGAQVSVKNSIVLFELMRETINNIKDYSINQQTLSTTKQYILGKHARSAQTVESVSEIYATDYFMFDEFKDDATFISRINSVTRQDLVSTLRSMHEGPWALGLLGAVNDDIATKLYALTDSMLNY